MSNLIISLLLSTVLTPRLEDAKYFENYLDERGLKSQTDKIYVIVSGNSCVYCSSYSKKVLGTMLDCPNLVVVTGDQGLAQQKQGKEGAQIIHDRSFDFDYLPYNLTGTNIIRFVNGQIQINSFDTKNIKDFQTTLAGHCRN